MKYDRFRYKGRFISESQAARLSNLKGASKHVTSERFGLNLKTERAYKGYRESFHKGTLKAFEAERRRIKEEAEARGRAAQAAQALKERRQEEERRAEDLAREIRRHAIEEDVSIEDAADFFSDEIEDFDYVRADDIIGMADVFEEEDFLDFDVEDLESDKYGEA